MELNEAVAKLDASLQQQTDNYCDAAKHDPPQSGPNLIDGLTGTPTPDSLLANMRKHNEREGTPEIPELPPKHPSTDRWDAAQCTSSKFPWQTHHLIPKKFLPTQPVCVWLTAKWTKDPDYQLAADTRYSTDHAKNGYCLPFASTTHQWKIARDDEEKTQAAFLVMRKTGKQLHQGNHDKQDFDEQEDDVELEGYIESIKALLGRIFDSALDHTDACEPCKSSGKKKVQPLHRIVDQVDLVSLITKLRIDANRIFVSQRAYDFYKASKQ